MGTDKLRQGMVVFSVVTMIVMNALSNTGVFGGRTNADVSAKYETLITPAGYAFSIWGLIYLGVLAFAIYQALPAQRTNPRFRAVGWLVVVNALCNALWSPIFNQEWIGLALIIILVMLFTLMVIEQRLLAQARVPIVAPDLDATLPEAPAGPAQTWLARIPFSIYFGWLTIATILNVAVYLKATQFSTMGLSEPAWAAVILIVGLVVGAVVFNRYRSVGYILVFAWAYAAIAAKQGDSSLVQAVAGIGAVVAIGLAIAGLVSKKTPSFA